MTAHPSDTRPTRALREEHQDLLPHIETLKSVAELVGGAPLDDVRAAVDQVIEFLQGHLIPHAMAEDVALYPVVAKTMGAPAATATMVRDHVEVIRLVDELEQYRGQLEAETTDHAAIEGLRRVLYGLYALVKVHFAKEEEVYLPLLDATLSPQDAAHMYEVMEREAHAAMQRRKR